jgi:hypothetical protein
MRNSGSAQIVIQLADKHLAELPRRGRLFREVVKLFTNLLLSRDRFCGNDFRWETAVTGGYP